MNKTYRNIWNAATQTWTAVAETAKSHSKGSARAARQAVIAIALGGAAIGSVAAAEACTTADGSSGTVDAAGVCKVAGSDMVSTMGAVGTTAALDDTFIKIATTGTASVVSGTNAIAIGGGASATGASSLALGNAATTTSSSSVAIGNSAVAIGGNNATAVGAGASATTAWATALGSGSTASANSAIVVGVQSVASGVAAIVMGNNALGSGDRSVALGSRASATGAFSVALGAQSVADRDNSVSVGSATRSRQITNVAAGTQDTDAVNFGQMNAGLSTTNASIAATNATLSTTNTTLAATNTALSTTNTNLAATNATLSTTNTQVTALQGDMTTAKSNIATHTTEITDINAKLSGLSDGTAGLVQQSAAGANLTVGANTDGAAVNFAGTAGDRKLSGIATGTADSDAVNVGQMNAGLSTTNASIAATNAALSTTNTTLAATNTALSTTNTQVTALQGDMTTAKANIATHTTEITDLNAKLSELSNGTVGLVQQSGAGADLTVGANTDGAAVNFTGTAGARKLTGIANGNVVSGSSDAVTGDQLHSTNQDVAKNASDLAGLGTQVTNIDGRVTANETNIAKNTGDITNINTKLGELSDGTVGLVQQSGAGADLTVGANTDGAAVNLTGTAGARKLTGIANGNVAAGSTDAVTGDQLHATNQDVAKNASDLAGLGTQVTNIDGRVTVNETNIAKNTGDITNINTKLGELSDGTVGLVQQAGAGADLTVGTNTDGAAVNFAGTAGARKLTGIANGDVAAGSTDAVTGDQLHTVATSVDNLGTRVTNNETSITQIRNDMSSGSIGLVQQAGAGANLTVGANTDGAAVNFAGTGGARTLSGVANGVKDSDAVTIAQLKATGLIDYTGKEVGAVTYDDGLKLDSVTFGGKDGTTLHNIAPGLIAAGSMDGVNGGQLYAMQQEFARQYGDLSNKVGDLSGRVGDLEAGGTVPGDGSGTPGYGPGTGTGGEGSLVVGGGADASGSNSSAIGQGAIASGSNGTSLGQGAAASGSNGTAIGQGAVASGSDSTAIGQGSVSSGANGTALGQGSVASGNNSVALGAGSVADRDNAVSVGSTGNERQITNVAAGTAPTDAVNVQQMNNTVHSARQDAMGGVAAAMAVAGLPQSTIPGRTFVSMAGSTYGGEYGSALGVSYMTRDGKWTVKASANTSSRGEVGAVIGGGFYW